MDLNQFCASYTVLREDIYAHIPKWCRSVLDVGCSVGTLGKKLKELGVKEVVGIEIDFAAANIAKENLTTVLIGSADEVELQKEGFENRHFDCIVYGDVLEHCINPWKIVAMHKQFLANDGIVVASLPNVSNINVIVNLLLGNFPYRDRGIFDNTHLRWFTKKTIIALFKNNGYKVNIVKRNYRTVEYTDSTISLVNKLDDMNKFKKAYNIIIRGGPRAIIEIGINYIFNSILPILFLFREYFVFQYILTAKKIDDETPK